MPTPHSRESYKPLPLTEQDRTDIAKHKEIHLNKKPKEEDETEQEQNEAKQNRTT